MAEKTQLLKLSVPATFMLVSLDEGPGPPIKYQYAELGKLYSVVSQLIRCCNVSSRMQSSINGKVKYSILYIGFKVLLTINSTSLKVILKKFQYKTRNLWKSMLWNILYFESCMFFTCLKGNLSIYLLLRLVSCLWSSSVTTNF